MIRELLRWATRASLNSCRTLFLIVTKHSVVTGTISRSRVGYNVRVKRGFLARSVVHDHVQLRESNIVVNSVIGRYTYLQRGTMVTYADVGAFCSIAENVRIGATNHDMSRFTTHEITFNKDYGFTVGGDASFERDLNLARASVGNDVWIGFGAVILPGVTVGDGSVIGAGCVVTKDIPPYAIVVGNPGRVIKFRFDSKTIDDLISSRWWDWPAEKIAEHMRFGSDVDKFLSPDPSTVQTDQRCGH